MEAYFSEQDRKIDEIYEIAKKARSLGIDPELEPEIPRAGDLAARVEKLVGPPGVADVIHELEKEMSREEVALKLVEMIVDGKFGKFSEQGAAEQAIRTALGVLTEGIVVAPLEGITHVEIRKNLDGGPYLAMYFASPIRAAGGTAAALAVLAGDFVRRRLYLNPYKPEEREVERFVEEVEIYRTSIAHEQYAPPPEDIRTAVRNLPVEITGEPTERDIQVTAFRDLERIGHNFVRGGAVLAMIEGVMQKAPKILKHVNKLNIDGWGWLSDLISKTPAADEAAPVFPKGETYLGEVIAGRPVFSHPGTEGHRGREGGFRLRYGRARNTGIAAVGVHPAAMVLCDDFIAVGTQLKTERPGKGGATTSVDLIEGPTVKLGDGSVVQVSSVEQALELRDKVTEILFLGDILVGFGEFLENNHPLMPAGYCEEWWAQEVERALANKKFNQDLTPYLSPPYPRPNPALAIRISEKLGVPLHPAYTYPYHDINVEELRELGNWLAGAEPEFEGEELRGLRLVLNQTPKRVLEELGVPHHVENVRVFIGEHALPLCRCLGLFEGRRLTRDKLEKTLQSSSAKDVMEIIQTLAGFPVRMKAPTRIGCRMGRPEKADPRIMRPPVHVLFPVGLRGGMTRSLVKAAAKEGETYVEVARLECPKCGAVGFTRKCQKCGGVTEYAKTCPRCGQPVTGDRCPMCNVRAEYFNKRGIDLKSHFEAALERLQEKPPALVKGVLGMTSACKIPEPIEKGILRAKHSVHVFKDGTIRFDATNLPLTHFRPREISTPVERLRELGYTRDIRGDPLENDDQLVELRVQDVIISNTGAEYLLRASKFVDELLQKLYGLPPYYNATRPADLVGHIVMGLAPHTSVGIAGRIIGFTDATVGYAHPFFHAAKRRDADGDEDCVMLLLDALLNFSRRFLPSKRGGTMDAPLIFNTRINPTEIDKEAHNMDVMARYPLEFYEATLRFGNPVEVAKLMETVERRLGTEAQYEGLGFSFDTSDLAAGPHSSKYKTLETMEEKVSAQLGLARRIRAVDERDVAERVIEHHFIPDLKGNMRTFGTQNFRCVGCNSIYRRVPLSGACTRCGGKLILTVTRGGVEKYLQVAMRVADEYNVSDYTKQRLELTQQDIKSMFESDASRQLSLADFM
ncbi:MAG: DNA polymerase II large subunit [Hadesarchaea archaeon]|nr:DNA polymerase II large subunit [Hadesarchaea archaeon]